MISAHSIVGCWYEQLQVSDIYERADPDGHAEIWQLLVECLSLSLACTKEGEKSLKVPRAAQSEIVWAW